MTNEKHHWNRFFKISDELKNELVRNKELYNKFMHEADIETARRILEEYKTSSGKLITLKKSWMEVLQELNDEEK